MCEPKGNGSALGKAKWGRPWTLFQKNLLSLLKEENVSQLYLSEIELWDCFLTAGVHWSLKMKHRKSFHLEIILQSRLKFEELFAWFIKKFSVHILTLIRSPFLLPR